MIKCCIFDLDGTLLNTLETITYYVNRALERTGLEPICKDKCRTFIGDGPKKLIERALRYRGVADPDTISKTLAGFIDDYNRDTLYLTHPYEGITELIAKLRDKGIKLAVLSNKQDSSSREVIAKIFPGGFDLVRGSFEGVPIKPSPQGGRIILDSLGIAPSEVAFIGDTDVDVLTGRNLGAALTVGVSWGFRDRSYLSGADVIADTADALFDAIVGYADASTADPC